MKEKISRLYSPCVIEIFIILFPIIEAITSIIKRNMTVSLSLGIIYKAVFVIYALLYLAFINKKSKKTLLIVLAIVVLFCIVNICVVKFSFKSISNISNLITLALSVLFFYAYINNGNELKINALVYCVLIYCVLIKVAEATGTQQATYRGDLTLGTKGWYYSGNELSAILSIFLPITIYYAASTLSFAGIATLILQIQTMLSIGTKTSLIVPIFVVIVYGTLSLINWLKNKSQLSKKILCILLVLIAYIVYILPNTASYKFFVVRIKENIQTTEPGINDNNDNQDLDDIIESNIDNFILNGRSDFLKAQKELYTNTTVLEKLFGTKYENRLGFDNNKQIKTIEIDMYDIAICFGMIGTVLFYFSVIYSILMYIYSFFKAISDEEGSVLFICLCVALAISCIAGHVLTSSTIVIFIAFLIGKLSELVREN